MFRITSTVVFVTFALSLAMVVGAQQQKPHATAELAGSNSEASGQVTAQGEIPELQGDWKLLFKPEETGSYVNDHTVYQHTDGSWHVIGITRKGRGDPSDEKFFCHGSSKTLVAENGMKEHKVVCDYGFKAYAPYALRSEEKCYLFWGPDLLRLDTSEDMFDWKSHGVVMDPADTDPNGTFRDAMAIKVGERWLKYSTGIESEGNNKGFGTVDLFESIDLIAWKRVGRALTTSEGAPYNTPWGCCESPFVVKRGDWFYLFVCYTDCSSQTYQNTLVFKSKDPTNFGDYNGDDDRLVTRLASHAGEVVFDEVNDKWYFTSCGWKGSSVVMDGAVAICELAWHDATTVNSRKDPAKQQLLAHWSFDEGKGTEAKDSSENGYHAKLMGNVTWEDDKERQGVLRLDGKGGWVDIPDLYLNDGFTFSAWCKLDGDIDNNDAIVGQNGPGQDLNFNEGSPRIFSPGDVLVSAQKIKPNEWFHLVVQREPMTMTTTIVINGDVTAEGFWAGCFQPKAIGRGNTGARTSGWIDDVKIFNR